MNKTTLLCEELLTAFHEKMGEQSMTCSFSNDDCSEGFKASAIKGTIHINARNSLAAAYGISQVSAACESGFLAEFLGDSTPRFPLRPLWIAAGGEAAISTDMSIALPRFMCASDQTEDQRDAAGALFCQRVIELGYNSVLLGYREGSAMAASATVQEAKAFIALLHAYGLKVLVKPTFSLGTDVPKNMRCCPVNVHYRKRISLCLQTLFQELPNIDYLFWEGGFLHADFTKDAAAKDMTLLELVTAEVVLLENVLTPKKKLIYYLPTRDSLSAKQQALWMPQLCDEVGEHTVIAFSAVAGDYFEDHLAPHPFWEELRKSPDVSSTQLMPLINIGMVLQGEGLWPAPPLDMLEKYYTRLCRHNFAGVVALVNMLPQKGSMLDCCLWVAGQALWRQSSPSILAEMWFRAFRAEWDYHESEGILNGARQLVVELSQLRSLTHEAKRDSILSEDCRVATESVLARLKELLLKAEKLECKRLKRGVMPSILDYLQVFSRDAQRIVLHFLQCFNLSYPHVMSAEELADSFWVHLSPGVGQGIRSATKVSFALEPNNGPAGSRMEAIFRENRLL